MDSTYVRATSSERLPAESAPSSQWEDEADVETTNSNPGGKPPADHPGQLQHLLELIRAEVWHELEPQLTVPASGTWVFVWHARVTIVAMGGYSAFCERLWLFSLPTIPIMNYAVP